jgi:hypothetical protein
VSFSFHFGSVMTLNCANVIGCSAYDAVVVVRVTGSAWV